MKSVILPVKKQPTYDERSKAFALKAQDLLLEARKHLADRVLAAAKKVTDTMDLGGVKATDAPLVRLELDAAKETLKVNGLYVEKVEHSGRVEGIQIYIPAQKEVSRGA